MKLLITRTLPDAVLSEARARFDVTLRDAERAMDQDEAAEALRNYDAVICTIGDAFRGEGLIDNARCRLLANVGVGYNHIDAEAAKARGIAVTSTPGVVTDATADIALTLILMICRRAGEGERMLRRGDWTGWTPMQMLGTHVTGRKLAVIGMGRIGQAVARRAHYGFEMEIGYFNRSQKDVDMPATQWDDLHDLLDWADLAVLTVPGGDETRHMIAGPELDALGQDSFLINIARGDVVDEEALIRALQNATIAGAGLDVYAREPHVPQALREMENTVLLPHLGTAALEVREAMGRMALSNVIALDEGRALETPI